MQDDNDKAKAKLKAEVAAAYNVPLPMVDMFLGTLEDESLIADISDTMQPAISNTMKAGIASLQFTTNDKQAYKVRRGIQAKFNGYTQVVRSALQAAGAINKNAMRAEMSGLGRNGVIE